MKNDITLPSFDTNIWWQKQIRLICTLNLPSFLFVCYLIFLFNFVYYFYCSVSNEEARHETESETSKQKRERPSKLAEKEREWTNEEAFKLIDLWLISLLARTVQNEWEHLLRLEVFNLKCIIFQKHLPCIKL